LIALLLAGFALRVFHAAHQEIWGDEGAKLEVVNQGLAHLFSPAAEVHPRFFHFWLFLWFPLFAYNVFALRMLPVLMGVLSLPLIYVLARRLFARVPAGRAASLAAVLVMAASPFHVAYSQDLTMYALLFAMLCLSYYALVRALETPSSWQGWASYALATLFTLHTHYYAVFAVAAQGAYVLLYRRRALRAWVLAQLAVAAGFLPWLYLHYRLLSGQAVDQVQDLTIANLGAILRQGTLAFTVGATFPGQYAWLGWIYALLVLAALVVLLARRPTRAPGALLGLWLLLPPILVWIFDVWLQHFGERFVSMSLPPLALLLAFSISHAPGRRIGPAILASAYVLTSLVALQRWYFDPAFLKSRYGEMLASIAAQARPGDVLLLDGPEQAILFRIYQPPGLDHRFVSPDMVNSDAAVERDLPELVAGYQRAWLVLFGAPAAYDPDHRAEAWLATHGYKAYYASYPGSYVTLYVLGSSQPPLQPANLEFAGGPRLTGYAYSPLVARRGETLFVTLEWQAAARMTVDYTVFTHVSNSDGQPVAQLDSQPASGTRPTSTWAPGETILDRRAILLPPDLPPGQYRVEIGLYDLATGQRLPLIAGSPQAGLDHPALGLVQVAP
jgi:mannosyltransferase